MGRGPQHFLDKRTPEQLRAEAKSYREAAAQRSSFAETKESFLRLAERYEAMADAREAEAGGR